MGVYVKNGTPLYGPSLCETCENAMTVKGYRESHSVVMCEAIYPVRQITFEVRECSRYLDRARQDLREVEKIAWTLAPQGSKRTAGFLVPSITSEGRNQEIEIVLDDANTGSERVK
jgi:hypothetical protein